MATARRRRGDSIAAALAALISIAVVVVPSPAANAAIPLADLTNVSAGGNHTCAVTSAGAVKCWGRNINGELGDSSGIRKLTPQPVPTLTQGFAAVAAGGSHTCAVALPAFGAGVWCWGLNNHAQLGNGGSAPAGTLRAPNRVAFDGAFPPVKQLALGAEHSCALLSSGNMMCWGRNDSGQLGINDDDETRFRPDAVFGVTGVRAIAASGKNTCALIDATGGVKCWGLNDHGQIGDGTIGVDRRAPVNVSGLTSGVKAISVGGQRACAVTVAGAAKCWGAGGSGGLGNGLLSDSPVPVAVSGLATGVDNITAGGSSACARMTTGALKCWGSDSSGQVGNGSPLTSTAAPVDVPGAGTDIATVTAGRLHLCLRRTSTGGTKCWGENENGQLGDGTIVDLYGPFLPDQPRNVVAVGGNQFATVTWAAPLFDGGSALDEYQVTSNPASQTLTVNAVAPHSATFTGLDNGTSYTFRVLVTNAFGASRLSSASNAVTPAGLPGAPTQLTATAGDKQVTISWKHAFTNGAAISKYRVVASPGGNSATVAGTKTKATVTGLKNGSTYSFTVRASNRVGTGPASAPVTKKLPIPKSGYWMLGANGTVYPFGDAKPLGSAIYPTWSSGVAAVAMAVKKDGSGYWVVDSSGGVRAFGTARSFGQHPPLNAGERVSTIAATPTGTGYWLFTNRGRAVPYGNAQFFGDMRRVALNGPVIASTATPTGKGYFMVASDGGVFTFGDARFRGSTGNIRLNKPVVGLSPTPTNRGYWLVASDGGVFAFGDARFRGSMGGTRLNKAVNGLVPFGNGYLMVASDGGVFNFSNKPFFGSLGSNPPAAPVIGIAAFTFVAG